MRITRWVDVFLCDFGCNPRFGPCGIPRTEGTETGQEVGLIAVSYAGTCGGVGRALGGYEDLREYRTREGCGSTH